ncbi:TetR/AcrR family transcriptional regulator [Nocardia neocaledoniensis]|uniref:TetR/AcrR family transcriptional regulator n=1 Tax=Nocardia neocaledoniensis TaxID=236511 RepID=UPI002457041E|nr:TetR/AcrR family transcriptional regulator [Nocardia neocaledoniensis]
MATKKQYFDTALEMLNTCGYGSLKQASLCRSLGVTTGSFYHYFGDWHDFTAQFLDNWLARSNTGLDFAASPKVRKERLESLLRFGTTLPHRAEAALRVWSELDAQAFEMQSRMDQRRIEVATEVLQDPLDALSAQQLAVRCLYTLIGYQHLRIGVGYPPLKPLLREIVRPALGTRTPLDLTESEKSSPHPSAINVRV